MAVCIANASILAALKENEGFQVGLLVGYVSADNKHDRIYAMVPTPLREENSVCKGLQEVSIEWMVTHAKQVLECLPGGIKCLGMYVKDSQDSDDVLTQAQAYIQAIRQAAMEVNWLTQLSTSSEAPMYILHVSPEGQCSARLLKKESTLIEIQWQHEMEPLQMFTASFQINEIIIASTPSSTVKSQLKQRLELLLKKVDNAKAIPGEDKANITFLYDPNSVQAKMKVNGNLSSFQGSIACRAFVPEKLKHAFTNAATHMKDDLSRTLSIRLNYVGDDMEHNQKLQPSRAIFCPRRATFPWPSVNKLSPFSGLLHVRSDGDLGDSYTTVHKVLSMPQQKLDLKLAQWIEDAKSTHNVSQLNAKKSSTANSSGFRIPMQLVVPCCVLVVALILKGLAQIIESMIQKNNIKK